MRYGNSRKLRKKRQHVCDFLLVVNSSLTEIVYRPVFHRFRDNCDELVNSELVFCFDVFTTLVSVKAVSDQIRDFICQGVLPRELPHEIGFRLVLILMTLLLLLLLLLRAIL